MRTLSVAIASALTLLFVAGRSLPQSRLPSVTRPGPSGKIAWRSIGPGEFGAMFGVAISPRDPRVIVAGLDMGNSFLTSNGGRSWEILGRSGARPFGNPGYRGTWGVHFDPRNPGRIWVGSEHGLYRTTDRGRHWRLVLGGTPDRTIHAIATDPTDPDIVYAANGVGARDAVSWARGDVWKSLDGGRHWRLLRPSGPRGQDPIKNRNWVTLAVDPQSPFLPGKGHSRIYICGQGGFYVSEDAGRTWTSLEDRLPGGRVNLNPDGVHTSGISDLALGPGAGRSTLFAAIQARRTGPGRDGWIGGVYASYDGGKTWTAKNGGLEPILAQMADGGPRYSLLALCNAKPHVMYWGAPDGVYKTEDGGESWREVTDLQTDWVKAPDFDGKPIDWLLRGRGGNFDQSYYNNYGPTNGLACSPTNPDVVAYTDNAGMGLSVDGGRHWTEPGFEFGAAYRPGAFGDRPPMRLTHKVRSRGIQLIVPEDLAVDPFDPKTIAIGHDDVGLTISRDGGLWWEWAYNGILNGEKNYIRAVLYDPKVRGRLWAAGGGWGGSGHVNRSDDGGRTFKVIGIPQLTAEAERIKRPLNIYTLALASASGARTLYAGTDHGLYRTSDGGATWEGAWTGLEAVPVIRSLAVDPADPARLYAAAMPDREQGTGAGLYRTEDGGSHWRRLGSESIGAVKSLSICRAGGVVYALASPPQGEFGSFWARRSLWRSADHGATWKRLTIPGAYAACVAAHPSDSKRIYVMTYASDVRTEPVNLFRSRDGGATWEAVADEIPLSPGGDGNKIVFDPANSSRLFLLHNSGTYEGIEARVTTE